MPADLLPLLVMIVISIGFAAVALIVSAMAGPHRPTPIKSMPYESGMPPIGSARRRVWIRYYLVAVLFILFDLEIIFFYPWAVIFKLQPLFLLVEMGIFALVLLVGYFYIWKMGGFDWQ